MRWNGRGIMESGPVSYTHLDVYKRQDVTTSGKSIEETFPIIKAQGDVTILGLMVSLNRMEKGKGEKSALDEIHDKYGFNAKAIVTMAEVIEYL